MCISRGTASSVSVHVIADRVYDMATNVYRAPVMSVDGISALGLKHVSSGILAEYMSPS